MLDKIIEISKMDNIDPKIRAKMIIDLQTTANKLVSSIIEDLDPDSEFFANGNNFLDRFKKW